jgi:transcription antitermination factor NusG
MSFSDTTQWFAVQVKPQHENSVAMQLAYKGQDVLLPKGDQQKIWSDRKVKTRRPLFPGYVFCRINQSTYSTVLNTPGVFRVVHFGGKPYPVSEEEMVSLRRLIDSGRQLSPTPYVTAGQKVLVTQGPLIGAIGIVERVQKRNRLIISVELVMRSVAVDINVLEVRPIY